MKPPGRKFSCLECDDGLCGANEHYCKECRSQRIASGAERPKASRWERAQAHERWLVELREECLAQRDVEPMEFDARDDEDRFYRAMELLTQDERGA